MESFMINVGSLDRVVRFVIGLALLISPFIPQFADFFLSWGMWKYAVAAVGLVLISTAMFRICPAYMLFGIRTCRAS
ncbi:DUF2892 domain-containing protein (plasmid) [Bradyrhizobium sp. SK17]|nr:DUF2892 domain-containing protein [Bradyrhizobium sp. SK17]